MSDPTPSGSSIPATDSAAQKPGILHIKQAVAALSLLLHGSKHAIVGGAALVLLGSTRATEDVDIVVPKGGTKELRDVIKKDGREKFTVDPRTLHTHFLSSPPVEIEILAPPGLFKGMFNQDTVTMTVPCNDAFAQILHPIALLDAKCGSIGSRADDQKKRTDSQDIHYLLFWMKTQTMKLFAEDVPNASVDWVKWFVATYGGGNDDEWKEVGWTENGFPQRE